MILEYIVKEEDNEKSIKSLLKSKLKISTRLLNKLKNIQKIFVNSKIAFVNENAHTGDQILIDFNYDEEDEIVPQEAKLEIIYEDEYYLAINKPSNLCVHPSSFHPKDTLANYVKYYLNNKKKIRPVNRLDNGTSGICLFAKNEYAQELFKMDYTNPTKEYIAILEGKMNKKEITVDAPINRKENSIIERRVDTENGQSAVTHFKLNKYIKVEDNECSLVNVQIETGRTHQIRVHSKYIGNPILGDSLYGKKSSLIDRQALHAHKLIFKHPILNKQIEIVAPIPEDMKKIIKMGD